MSEYKLIEEIIKHSVSPVWDQAKKEWYLDDIFFNREEDYECICGKFPIVEICTLKNKTNSNEVIVGNICVKKFMGIPSDKIFKSIRNIKKDITKSLSDYALEYVYKKNWINKWEYEFNISIYKKRNLSPKQLDMRTKINIKILKLSK